MGNIESYLKWRGDIPFTLDGLNEIDNLVFCTLVYFDMAESLSESKTAQLSDICAKVRSSGENAVRNVSLDISAYMSFLDSIEGSSRFGNVIVSDYVDVYDVDKQTQFAACVFHISDSKGYIAFRGTDDTLIGWKEDFMISFTKTEAQELALAYAKKHLSPGKRWYMGGHSKGGNELLYAAALLPDDCWNTVDRIFLLDGPGLCPEVMSLDGMQRVDSKTTRVIPSFSVIGKLFEPRITDTRIIRSSAIGIQQHGLSTWGIDHGRLALAEDNDPTSKWISETLDLWIGSITQEERPVFVNELFDALSAGGATTLNQLDKEGREGLEAVLKQFGSSSELTRKTISELPKQAFRVGLNQLRQHLEDGMQELENKIAASEEEIRKS